MKEQNLELVNAARIPSHSLRDWVAPCFRHGRLMMVSFLTMLAIVVVVTWMIPARYQAQVKILVKRERADPVVNPDPNTQLAVASLTEEDLNSEVELLRSRDLLEKVVVASGLDKRATSSFLGSILAAVEGGPPKQVSADRVRILRAVRSLEKSLYVEPRKKSKLIVLIYESPDPQLSAKVLQTLVRLYLEKHVAVHRVPGALDFFENQTDQYRQRLLETQQKMAGFGRENGVVAASMEKEMTIRKLGDFEGDLQKTRATIAETEQRIRALEELASSTPERLTSQVRTLDNPVLLQQLKSTLLDLEMKRSQLLSKFDPDYRPVKDIEVQIAQARDTLIKEQNNPLHEETTDRNATHEWVKGELARARAELIGLRAQAAAASQIVDAYRVRARELNQAEIIQQDLVRSAKLAEDNFLLYSRKQEEARIEDTLDQRRIINLSVAEDATAPGLPAGPQRALSIALGGLLACFVSIGLGYTADYLDSTFRTPKEVEVFLNTQVLASLPKHGTRVVEALRSSND